METQPKHNFEVKLTRTHRVYIGEEGILYSEVLPQAEVGLEDAKAGVQAGIDLSQGVRRPVLVDFGQVKSISREARAYFSGPETTQSVLAIALVIQSPIGKVIGNFMMGLNRTSYPTRLFTSRVEAVKWLLQMKEQTQGS